MAAAASSSGVRGEDPGGVPFDSTAATGAVNGDRRPAIFVPSDFSGGCLFGGRGGWRGGKGNYVLVAIRSTFFASLFFLN
jgi:hypothetical protein